MSMFPEPGEMGKSAQMFELLPLAPGQRLAVPRMMSDWLDAIDHIPGHPPDLRKVGTSLLVVMPIRDVAPEYPNVRLVLRLETNGDLFAAIAGGSAEPR